MPLRRKQHWMLLLYFVDVNIMCSLFVCVSEYEQGGGLTA